MSADFDNNCVDRSRHRVREIDKACKSARQSDEGEKNNDNKTKERQNTKTKGSANSELTSWWEVLVALLGNDTSGVPDNDQKFNTTYVSRVSARVSPTGGLVSSGTSLSMTDNNNFFRGKCLGGWRVLDG